ncbi:LysR family transcriptional regulator [Streptomyces sp. NPDC097727]|uniref:LysR family transcriptional regulator n=1 Tax=Streptomyces sp. NPDC097727 TaxID=3366092 RepID=UPI00382A96FD
MEIRQLRHSMAVVTHGGFTAAARAELIVRSAPSTSVRNLEREPGAELFDRTGLRVILTEAGRTLLPSARSVLAARCSLLIDLVRAGIGVASVPRRIGEEAGLPCVSIRRPGPGRTVVLARAGAPPPQPWGAGAPRPADRRRSPGG